MRRNKRAMWHVAFQSDGLSCDVFAFILARYWLTPETEKARFWETDHLAAFQREERPGFCGTMSHAPGEELCKLFGISSQDHLTHVRKGN